MEIKITINIEGDEVKVSHEVTKTDEKKLEVKIDKGNRGDFSQYAKIFDESCNGWTKDSEYNKMYLLTQQNYCNDLLRNKGHLYLNEVYEVYDILGIPRTKTGQLVGWIYDEENPCGDNFIDFGLGHERNKDFINGYSRTAFLDFNVDGNIIDMM